jgi:hypothetical protein
MLSQTLLRHLPPRHPLLSRRPAGSLPSIPHPLLRQAADLLVSTRDSALQHLNNRSTNLHKHHSSRRVSRNKVSTMLLMVSDKHQHLKMHSTGSAMDISSQLQHQCHSLN